MKALLWFLSTTVMAMLLLVVSSARIDSRFVGSAVSPGACTELVSDGGFEAGGQGWVQYSKLGYQLISSFYRRNGQLGAWLGAENNAYDRLSQLVVLPAQTDRITLRLWWAVSTAENPGAAFDFLRTGLYTQDGKTQIVSLLDVNNDSAEQWVWNAVTADLSAYAGRSVQLRIEATTDENNATSFFVDDVSIISCPAITPTSSPTATRTTTPTATVTPSTGTPPSTPTATRTPAPGTPPPSVTWTATSTATQSLTPVPSATQSPTGTATRTPTPTSTPQGWVSPTPTETRTPGLLDRRMYLPVLLRMP